MRRLGVVMGLLGAAWVTSVVAQRGHWIRQDLRGPVLSTLFTTPWDGRSDVMSSVNSLFATVVVVSGAVLLAEIAKVIAAPFFGSGAILAIALFQVSLAYDGLRLLAPDWWNGAVFWVTNHPKPIIPLDVLPFRSFAVLIIVGIYLWRRERQVTTMNDATA